MVHEFVVKYRINAFEGSKTIVVRSRSNKPDLISQQAEEQAIKEIARIGAFFNVIPKIVSVRAV